MTDETETSNIRIRKTWLLCQVLNVFKKDGAWLAYVTPYVLGHRYDIRFPITDDQEQALRPYVAERRIVSMPVAIKQNKRGQLLALSMLESPPVHGENRSGLMAYVTPFFDCGRPWTK